LRAAIARRHTNLQSNVMPFDCKLVLKVLHTLFIYGNGCTLYVYFNRYALIWQSRLHDWLNLLKQDTKKTTTQRLIGVFAGIFVIAACSAAGWPFRGQPHQAFHLMLYLLGVVAVALLWGRLASCIAAVLGMIAFDYLFVDSLIQRSFKFHLHSHNIVVFSGMLGIAQLVAWLIRDLRVKTRTTLNMLIEQARLREEADTAKLEAESERARNVLLSSVSHDLRTPLASIKIAAESLVTEYSTIKPDESRELALMLLNEAERLDHMLSNLLDITRLEDTFIRLNKDWQTVEEVIGAVLTRLESQKGKLPITVELASNLPLVQIDGVLFEQLLSNIIENAIRYAPGKPVNILAEYQTGQIRMEIRDNGSGVPKDLQERIFDKFYRNPGLGDGGTGLGLAICKAIVQAHDGKIWVEDAPNGGAAFVFTLPAGGVSPVVSG
jgi:K+-sensing histidine kinase KdpD